MRTAPALLAFNRGVVSRLGLARVDIDRMRLSAETQTNWMPRALGSMMLRPGLRYLGATYRNRRACCAPFVFEANDLARLEFTDGWLRIWREDAPLRRSGVTARIANGGFQSGLAGWTSADEVGAVSGWSGGRMTLQGTGAQAAKRWAQVAVGVGERKREHALRVSVARGPVTLTVGSAPGSDDMMPETMLGAGVHSLAFTPDAGAFTVQVSHRGAHSAALAAIEIETEGDILLPTPYAESDLPNLRWTQSRDVIFLAADGHQPRRVERRDIRSWSIVAYETEDGPFRPENLSQVTLRATGLEGDVALISSAEVFRPGHVGALFRLSSAGQNVAADIAAEDVFTGEIRVTGVGDDRKFRATVSGGAGTVTLQRSVGAPGDWSDVEAIEDAAKTIDDELDNQIIYYRIGVKAGDFASGPIAVSLTYARGSIDGIARVTYVRSPTRAAAVVLKLFGSTKATSIWAEGAWSDVRGWPTAVRLFEGRLWWGGRGKLWGSVSDAFASFDAGLEGDAAPIDKTISDGPSDVVTWIEVGQRMVLGAVGGAFEARASSLDEPLTPTACELRRFSTAGCANLPAVAIDDRVHFVQRAARELLEARVESGVGRHQALRLTALVPEIGGAGFVRLAVQHQPDVRLHCVRADGTAAVLVTDPAEEVRCWIDVETDGVIEDVTVMPDGQEDAVYYIVQRTVGGMTRRFHERWALEDDCRGGRLNMQADCHVLYEGPPTNVVRGLDHLEGREVVVWADGGVRASAKVAGGMVGLSGAPASAAVVGLGYEARFRSAKLAYGGRKGPALMQPKRINRLSFVLADAHARGLYYGPDFERLDPLPPLRPHGAFDGDAVYRDYDFDGAPFPGAWSTDVRLCLKAEAPKPCTVLGVGLDLETVER